MDTAPSEKRVTNEASILLPIDKLVRVELDTAGNRSNPCRSQAHKDRPGLPVDSQRSFAVHRRYSVSPSVNLIR